MGIKWERLVGLKNILRRILGRASLNFEEFHSIVCDVEGTTNSRLLTILSEDADDIIPLTPNMFLQGIRGSGLSDLDNF